MVETIPTNLDLLYEYFSKVDFNILPTADAAIVPIVGRKYVEGACHTKDLMTGFSAPII